MSTFQLNVKSINEAESEIKFIIITLSEIQNQLNSQISRLDSCFVCSANYEVKNKLSSVSSNQIASVSDNLSQLINTLEEISETAGKYEKKAASDTLSDNSESITPQYSEADLRKMSKEERDKYINHLLNLKNPTNKEKAEIKVVLGYVSDSIKSMAFPFAAVSCKGQTELYNRLYEKIHPNDGRKMNKLFKDAPSEFANDIQYIKYMAYNSTGQCHDLFFKYVDRIKISEYYAGKNLLDPNDVSMHLNMKDIRGRNNDYGTFFHEAGHGVDRLMAIDSKDNNGKIHYSSILANGGFHDVIYKDTENIVTKTVDNYSNNEKHLSNEDKALITDILMGRKRESELKNSDIDFAYRKISEDITGKWKGAYSRKYMFGDRKGLLNGENANMLSEVMNGMTNNSLMVDEYNTVWKQQLTYGHPIDWQNPDPNAGYVSQNYYYNEDGSPTGHAETEYMAEYFRINMTNRTSEIEYTKRHLGNSWDFLDRELGKCI